MEDLKVVASKIPSTLFVQLQRYCEMEGMSPSALIKSLIEAEVAQVVPHNKAARNVLSYNKRHDTFIWAVEYDDGSSVTLANEVSPAFIEDALKSLSSELRAREMYLQKARPSSVPAPTKMKVVK